MVYTLQTILYVTMDSYVILYYGSISLICYDYRHLVVWPITCFHSDKPVIYNIL